MDISIGLTGRLGFKKHFHVNLKNSYVIHSEAVDFKIYPLVFQCGAEFYIPRKSGDNKKNNNENTSTDQ